MKEEGKEEEGRIEDRTQWKKKKKKRNPETACSEGRRRSHLVWKEKEKKRRWRNACTEPSEERKKKKEMVKSCGWVWQWVPLCSVIYGNAIENRVMKTKNS